MGMIQLRERWRRQPGRLVGVDWSNPLARGLRFLALPTGNTWVDVASGRLAALGNSSANGAPSAGAFGASLYYAQANSYPQYLTMPDFKPATSDFWVLVSGTFEAAALAVVALSNDAMQDGGANQWRMQPNYDGSAVGGGSFAFLTYGGAFVNAGAASAFVAGKAYTFLGVRRGTTVELWRDGVLLASSTGTAQNVSGSETQSIGFGFGATGYANVAGGHRFLGAGGINTLSAAQAMALSRNPWELFRPKSSPLFFTAGGATSGAGASAGTGVASAASQATWASVGASAGAGAASATSQATWAAVGASAGAGAASATGTDANGGISSATAASSGTGAAAATARATWATVGASSGTGAAAATARATWATVGASAGAGAGAATSRTVAASIGASAGVGAAAATGDDANSAFSSATAASSGTGAAAATSRATWATVAASVATSSVTATANAVWAGVGASTGTATASADGVTGSAVQAAAGTATASSTAGAVAQVVVAAVGTIAAVAVAGGVSNAISAVVEVVGAAVAVAVASAVTQAIWNAVGASTGAAAAAGASPVTLDAAAVARQIVVRTMEAVVVVTSRGLASKVVTDG